MKGSKMRKWSLLFAFFISNVAAAQGILVQEIPFEAPVAAVEVSNKVEPVVLPRSSNLDDLYTTLDAESVALRELTERFEQMEHRLQVLEEKMTRFQQDVDFRLTELESKSVLPTTPIVLDKKSDKERYDYAYGLLKKKEYQQAEAQFLSFLADFDKSDLRPNALYWLGETYYAQGMYEKAVGQFADVFQKYSKANKAPDALLKMGLSMASLNKKQEACTAFIALPNEYPKADSSLKQRAEQEAKKYKCL